MFDVKQVQKLIEKYTLEGSYYEGYVVQVGDGDKCSRVRVHVQGVTIKKNKDGQDELLAVDDLPWYPTMQGFGEGGNSGTNIPPVDSRVLVIYPTDDIYNGIVVGQVPSISPEGITTSGANYKIVPGSGGSTSNNTTPSSVQADSNGTIVATGEPVGANPAKAVEIPSQNKRVYVQEDGTKVVKEGGTRAWRNNNEGNIRFGDYAKSKGAIGADKDGFAIFPNEETGHKAKEDLIFNNKNYKDKTLDEAIHRYAPPNENNTSWYQKTVKDSVGGQNKKMSEYTPEERQSIMAAMKKVEGYKAGKTYTT